MNTTANHACRYCQGTGKVVLMRSWFPSDGFKFAKCGICSGTGASSYRPEAEWVSDQLRLRKLFCVEV